MEKQSRSGTLRNIFDPKLMPRKFQEKIRERVDHFHKKESFLKILEVNLRSSKTQRFCYPEAIYNNSCSYEDGSNSKTQDENFYFFKIELNFIVHVNHVNQDFIDNTVLQLVRLSLYTIKIIVPYTSQLSYNSQLNIINNI